MKRLIRPLPSSIARTLAGRLMFANFQRAIKTMVSTAKLRNTPKIWHNLMLNSILTSKKAKKALNSERKEV